MGENSIKKLKIGFDLNLWDSMFFVNYIKRVIQEDLYDVYILSVLTENSPTSNQIILGTGINEDNICWYSDKEHLADDYTFKGFIDIYCSSIENFNYLNSLDIIPIVELNNIQNMYNLEPKWISKLNFWIRYLNR